MTPVSSVGWLGSCPQGWEPSAVSRLSQGGRQPVSRLLPAPKPTPRGTTKDLINLPAFSIWEAEIRTLATGGHADRCMFLEKLRAWDARHPCSILGLS